MIKTTIERLLSALVGVTALSYMGLGLWYVFGDLPNPLPPQVAVLPGLGFVGEAFRWLLGLACYLIAGAALITILHATSRIVLVGWAGFIAEEKEKSAEAKKAAIRPVGTLVAVSVEKVGFLDSATSMIETTEGFYRIFGKVNFAAKGEQVTIQKESRSILTIEWLRFAGEKYQLTK